MPGGPVFGPINNDELSGEDRKKALEAHPIKEKHMEISRVEHVQMVVDRKVI